MPVVELVHGLTDNSQPVRNLGRAHQFRDVDLASHRSRS
jgi:hypothetical protein